jgi:hypothetical protein
MIKIRSTAVLLYFYVKKVICKYRKMGKIIRKQINYDKRLKVVLLNEKYCIQIRYEMRLFSMRNLIIRLLYHGKMGKIGKLKLGSAVEPAHWAIRKRRLAQLSSNFLKRNLSNFAITNQF